MLAGCRLDMVMTNSLLVMTNGSCIVASIAVYLDNLTVPTPLRVQRYTQGASGWWEVNLLSVRRGAGHTPLRARTRTYRAVRLHSTVMSFALL
jgi:hypothetical protein